MIQTLFPTQKEFINICQNAVSFLTLSSVTYLYFVNQIDTCYYILFSYLSVDLLFAEPVLALHHVLCLLTLSCKYSFNLNEYESNLTLKPFVKTEISTIFLIFKVVYEKNAPESIKKNRIVNVLYKINDFIFVAIFVKTRIWDLLFDAMLNPEIHQHAIAHTNGSILKKANFYVGFCGLYFMNLYWFAIICRNLYKQIVIKTQLAWINTAAIADRILPWTKFAAFIPYAIMANAVWRMFYTERMNYVYYLSLLEYVVAIGFSSYIYHSKKRDNLRSALSNSLFFDAGATHLKSLFALVAMGKGGGATSAAIHAISFLASCYDTDESNANLTAFTMGPALYDAVNIIYLVDDRINQMKIGIVVVALITIYKVKPAYELNQILEHLLEILYMWVLVCSLP
jgi:hypothetical protein